MSTMLILNLQTGAIGPGCLTLEVVRPKDNVVRKVVYCVTKGFISDDNFLPFSYTQFIKKDMSLNSARQAKIIIIKKKEKRNTELAACLISQAQIQQDSPHAKVMHVMSDS